VHVETLAVGPLGCNCSLVADLHAREAIVVDPGGNLEEIRERLAAHRLKVTGIVHTHTHIDHVGCTAELQRATGAAASIHEGDRFLYDMLAVQAALIGTPLPEKADMDGGLVDGHTLRAGSLEMAVLHTPGHTPGSCSFLVQKSGKAQLFAGDTLFRGSIGRTDLWGGDSEEILRSIRGKLLTLPEDTVVVTGHGPSTTIGHERVRNPFLRRP
jgi:glyoxylase-like metal-dependent hydrolase (beta-lactamase superfamily II)